MRDDEIALPICFGSEADIQDYVREVQFSLKAQCTRFAVAPRCRLLTPDGRVLVGGDPVDAQDFDGYSDAMGRSMSPMSRLRQLVRTGHVLERPDLDDLESTGPEAA